VKEDGDDLELQYRYTWRNWVRQDDFLNVLPVMLSNPEAAGSVQSSLRIMKSWACGKTD
jgi:hypothetical protein